MISRVFLHSFLTLSSFFDTVVGLSRGDDGSKARLDINDVAELVVNNPKDNTIRIYFLEFTPCFYFLYVFVFVVRGRIPESEGPIHITGCIKLIYRS